MNIGEGQGFPRLGECGQGYVSVLIVIAIISGLSAAVLKSASDLRTEIHHSTEKEAELRFAADLSAAVQMSDVCRAIFNANVEPFAAGRTLPVQVRWVDGLVLAAGAKVVDYELLIHRLELIDVVKTGTLSPTRDLYTANLQVQGSNATDGFLFRPLKVTPMFFEVEGGRADVCYGPTNYLAVAPDLCKAAGATFSNGQCVTKPTFPNIACDEGEYLQSFSTDGSKTCKALPPDALSGDSTAVPPPPTTGTWNSNCFNCGSSAACALKNPTGQSCSPVGAKCSQDFGFGINLEYACR